MFRIEEVKQFAYTNVIYSSNEVRTLLYGGEAIAHAAYGVCWVKFSLKKLEEDNISNSSKAIHWFLNTFKRMWEFNDQRIIYGNVGGFDAITRLGVTL